MVWDTDDREENTGTCYHTDERRTGSGTMRRLHLIEFHEQAWCPRAVRNAMTDYLRFVEEMADVYRPIAARLGRALETSGTNHVVDLCSGAGGPWLRLYEEFCNNGQKILVTVSDLHPNAEGFGIAPHQAREHLTYSTEPVDAKHVPKDVTGFRTLFTAFHHFRPDDARAILQDAVNSGEGIAVFEATKRSLVPCLAMLLTPIVVLLVTPFIRPFRWSRLFWTYLVPLVTVLTPFDGIVSCLRTYTVDELRTMTDELTGPAYHWEIGEEPVSGAPASITYLIGYPEAATPES